VWLTAAKAVAVVSVVNSDIVICEAEVITEIVDGLLQQVLQYTHLNSELFCMPILNDTAS